MLMEVGGAKKFVASNRSLMLIIPVCVLLLASAIWNVWQYRIIEQQRLQALAAEREAKAVAARSKIEAERAKLKKTAAAASDARVDQLYQEINNLTRINERVLLRNPSPQGTLSSKKDGDGEAAAVP
jgi:hypothetical protein